MTFINIKYTKSYTQCAHIQNDIYRQTTIILLKISYIYNEDWNAVTHIECMRTVDLMILYES